MGSIGLIRNTSGQSLALNKAQIGKYRPSLAVFTDMAIFTASDCPLFVPYIDTLSQNFNFVKSLSAIKVHLMSLVFDILFLISESLVCDNQINIVDRNYITGVNIHIWKYFTIKCNGWLTVVNVYTKKIGIFYLDLWKKSGTGDLILFHTQRIEVLNTGNNAIPVVDKVFVKRGLLIGIHAITHGLIATDANDDFPVDVYEIPTDNIVWEKGVLRSSHLQHVTTVDKTPSLGIIVSSAPQIHDGGNVVCTFCCEHSKYDPVWGEDSPGFQYFIL